MTMSNETKEPTHTPLYLGMIPEAAVCERHGEMRRWHIPVFVHKEHVYAVLDRAALYQCPECCIDLIALAGDPNMDPDQTRTVLRRQYVETHWDDVIEHLVVDLGPGCIETRDEGIVVLPDDAEEAVISEYLLDRDDCGFDERPDSERMAS
jgi:hypothetical protein